MIRIVRRRHGQIVVIGRITRNNIRIITRRRRHMRKRHRRRRTNRRRITGRIIRRITTTT